MTRSNQVISYLENGNTKMAFKSQKLKKDKNPYAEERQTGRLN